MSDQSSAAKLEAKIVEKPAFTAVGMLVRTTPGNPNMMQLWQDFGGQVQRVRGQANPGLFYGAMHNYDMQTGQFDYLAAVEVEAGQEAPEGMVVWQVPAQTYAVFETTLPEIGPAYEYIYGPWIAGADFERTDGPEFELYGEEFNPEDPSSKMHIYIPVQPK